MKALELEDRSRAFSVLGFGGTKVVNHLRRVYTFSYIYIYVYILFTALQVHCWQTSLLNCKEPSYLQMLSGWLGMGRK